MSEEREIKFRAWVESRKKMVYFNLFDTDGDYHIDEECCLEECPTMQHTGLKDKNGKEIYKGDILRHIINDNSTQTGLFVDMRVVFMGGAFCVERDTLNGKREFYLGGYYKESEVIGNIYENPELLEEK